MPQGLQLWDAAGNLTFDTTHSIPKIFGTVVISNAATGSVTDSRYSAVTSGVATLLTILVATNSSGRLYDGPSISLSGNVLSWSWPSGITRWPLTLVYGIY